jgi:endonuclease G, mitochondrial
MTGAAVRLAVLCCLSLQWASTAHADDRNCTDDEKAAANKLLFLNQRDKKGSEAKHLPWGTPEPAGATTSLLAHRDYVVRYSNTLRVPMWTAHRLDAKGLNTTPDRVNCFRQDPRVDSPKAALPGDYDEPDFDQGHLVPSEDLSRNVSQNVNSFVMSNMAPQYGEFNRVIWKRLETQTREWATFYGTVYVISGSVFDWSGNGKPDAEGAAKRMKARNGTKRVAIPSHFYKIVVRKCPKDKLASIAFMLPNEQKSHTGDAGQKYLEEHITSIAKIEAASGLELFRGPAGNKIDRTDKHAMWPIKPPGTIAACGDN